MLLKPNPYGIVVGHEWDEVGVLLDVIEHEGVRSFIELGVHEGGLTALLSPLTHHKPGFRYLAVEINSGIPLATVKTLPGVQFMWGDCFDLAVITEIDRWLVSAPKPTFIYCDNGDKPREFRTYAKLLRKGDIIAAHDTGTEIFLEDVGPVAEEHNLLPIFHETPTRITIWRKP